MLEIIKVAEDYLGVAVASTQLSWNPHVATEQVLWQTVNEEPVEMQH